MFPPFTPSGSTATLAVTNATGRVALAWSGQRTLRVKNAPESAARMFVKTGDVTVTAATTDTPVDPGETIELSIADADTYIAAITAASTATLLATSGQGQSGATAGGPSTVTVTPAGTQNVNLAQVGGAAVALGQAAMAASVPVAIASNQSAVPASQSGTWTVSLPAAGTSVAGSVAAGTAGITSALTGGVYNSSTPTLTTGQQVARQVDPQGAEYVSTQGMKKTYRVSQVGLAPTAAGTLVQLQGSASKTVKVTMIRFSGVLTAAAAGRLRLFKNSATETGGTTATAGTVVQLDTAQPNAAAATAVETAYTTAGTPGALVGTIDSVQYFIGTAAAIGMAPLEFLFGTRNAEPLVLRGTGEFLVLANTFGAYTGASWDIVIEWTEE